MLSGGGSTDTMLVMLCTFGGPSDIYFCTGISQAVVAGAHVGSSKAMNSQIGILIKVDIDRLWSVRFAVKDALLLEQ